MLGNMDAKSGVWWDGHAALYVPETGMWRKKDACLFAIYPQFVFSVNTNLAHRLSVRLGNGVESLAMPYHFLILVSIALYV